MTPRTHGIYFAVGVLFAAYFAASLFIASLPIVPPLGVLVLIAVLYFSSFARGFGDEE